MTILVTGGSGFIGSHLVDALVRHGHRVRVMDAVPAHRSDVEFVKASITYPEATKEAARDCSHIFHLAAVSNVDEAYQNALKTIEVNITGTANVLEAARRHS